MSRPRITRHVWLVINKEGRALYYSLNVLACFPTRAAAKRWAYTHCSIRPLVRKCSVPEWWSATP